MDDLIDREEALRALDEHCDAVCEYSKKQRFVMCGACPLGTAFDVIEELPSAQPERKKGKWKEETRRTVHGYDFPISICSECGKMAVDEYNFCPNCGADMRGDNEGDD